MSARQPPPPDPANLAGLWRGPAARAAVLAAATFVLALATLAASDGAPLVWPVNAVVVAMLLRSPQDRWPGLLAGGLASVLAAYLLAGRALGPAAGLALAHGIEISTCAWVLRRGCGTPVDLTRWRNLALFGLVGGLVAPLLSATVAAAVLVGAHGE